MNGMEIIKRTEKESVDPFTVGQSPGCVVSPLFSRLRGGGKRPGLTDSDIDDIIIRSLKESPRFKGTIPQDESDQLRPAEKQITDTGANRAMATAASELFSLNAQNAVRRCKAANRTLLVWVPADAGDAGEASRTMMQTVWTDPEVCSPAAPQHQSNIG